MFTGIMTAPIPNPVDCVDTVATLYVLLAGISETSDILATAGLPSSVTIFADSGFVTAVADRCISTSATADRLDGGGLMLTWNPSTACRRRTPIPPPPANDL